MDNYLGIYVNQRMSEMGIKKFHHEPVLLVTDRDKPEYRIDGYNNYFYLVSKDIANGTVIYSDTNIYPADQHYDKQNLHQIQEFTGLIIIINPPRTVQLLEFIRVTPL
jgi:hypothetical protein